MKFALAAGLLTGSLPAVSADAAETTLEVAQNILLRNANGAIHSLKSTQRDCNPLSNEPDVGVLSCGQGHFCKPNEDSMLGGVCESKENLLNHASLARFRQRGILRNARKARHGAVECDPMADPDVGILNCDSGEICIPSTTSSMGGLCVSSTTGRKLQDYWTSYCDPAAYLYQYFDCDCSGLDQDTGNGEVTCKPLNNTCLGDFYPGCDDVCVSSQFTTYYANFTLPNYVACYESVAPYKQVVCFDQSVEDYTCSISFNDAPCTSCELVPNGNYTSISFDCVNAGGIVGISNYSSDILPIVQACASTPSGTSSPSSNSTYVCSICDGPLVYPEAEATLQGFTFTCAQAELSLNATTCPLAGPMLAPTCCGAGGSGSTTAPVTSEPVTSEPTPAPGDDEEPAPVPGPGGDTLPPSAGSMITIAKSTWLVSLGLAVAWTLGHTR